MKKIIQDLWIQRTEGTVLFSRVFHQNIHTQLFGALMSALNSFAKEVASGGLSSFEISNIRFSILKKNQLLFIANYAKRTKEKKVLAVLETLSDLFTKKFPETIEQDWCEDINSYLCFEKDIENLLEDPVKKFWSDF